MRFDIITIFPDIFDCYFNESIIKRAQKRRLVDINIHDLRNYTSDRHRTVDSRPYSGGAGMILMAEPILRAVQEIKRKKRTRDRRVILLSAKGKKFNQKTAGRLAKNKQLILICGRYEGVDERVAKHIADEEVSVGEYVLTGGELPAMVMVDAITRLLPGAISKESLEEESYSAGSKRRKNDSGFQREYPQYARPREIKIDGRKRRVPAALLSGDHQRIKEWRRKYRRDG